MIRKADLLFLTFLRRNARETLTTISRKTNIPISTLYDKLRQHETNVILKHTTLVDFEKLGYNCRAEIMLSSPKDDRDKIRVFLKGYPLINSLFKINNGYDFLAEGVFENAKELEEFVEMLESKFQISDKKVFYVIEDIKREEFLSEPGSLSQLAQMKYVEKPINAQKYGC
ncbi:Lrp/AsnC family transcriptional regulator [Candidatus Woesearchaeota archaeon]|nr:Lrp/AsnC family transcriptional regulator [Candidatus Woesearchaeota archaeon]